MKNLFTLLIIFFFGTKTYSQVSKNLIIDKDTNLLIGSHFVNKNDTVEWKSDCAFIFTDGYSLDSISLNDKKIDDSLLVNTKGGYFFIENAELGLSKKTYNIKKDQIITVNIQFIDFSTGINKSFKLKLKYTGEPTIYRDKISNSDNANEGFHKLGNNILHDAIILTGKGNASLTELDREALLKKYNLIKSDANNIPYLANNINLTKRELQSGKTQYTSNMAKADVTNFATGMARFLADRAKAEMNESFFKIMHAKLDRNAELRHFFLHSHYYLNTTFTQNRMVNIEAIKDVFEKDIRQFPINIYDIKNLNDSVFKRFEGYKHFMNHTVGGKWVDYGFDIMRENNWRINPKELLASLNSQKLGHLLLSQINFIKLNDTLFNEVKDNLGSIFPDSISATIKKLSATNINEFLSNIDLTKLNRSEYDNLSKVFYKSLKTINNDASLYPKLYNFVNGIKLLELISSSLLSPEDDRYWVSGKEVESLFKDTRLLETYLGLLIAKSDFDNYKISFMSKDGQISTLKSLLENVYEHQGYMKFRDLIKDIHNTFTSVDDIAKGFATADKDAKLANVQRLFSFVGESIQTFNSHFNYRQMFKGNFEIDNKLFSKFVMPSIDITMHLQSKQYNLAIEDAVVLLSNIYQDDEYKHLNRSEDRAQTKFINQFAKYGTLVANVACAQNSDQVKAAIEATVMPVGSSRIKRYSNWSIMANSYVGGFVGNAFYKVNDADLSIRTFGITAPIGLTVSKGNIRFLGKKNTLGLNLQMIDLGSLVNFYLQKGDQAALPKDTKIQLGDILAPGASISYSLFNAPFSVIGGVQYVPNLSRMQEINTNTDFRPLTWRWHLGLVIDIPMMSLKVWN